MITPAALEGDDVGDIHVRRSRPEDAPAVTALLRASLGKQDDAHYEDFLRWKHEQNPFGPSPAWVAVDDDRVVGFRTLLRWRFVTDEGKVLTAVRAVDTATDPDYRGRGIFRLLTLDAVADLTRAGHDPDDWAFAPLPDNGTENEHDRRQEVR